MSRASHLNDPLQADKKKPDPAAGRDQRGAYERHVEDRCTHASVVPPGSILVRDFFSQTRHGRVANAPVTAAALDAEVVLLALMLLRSSLVLDQRSVDLFDSGHGRR